MTRSRRQRRLALIAATSALVAAWSTAPAHGSQDIEAEGMHVGAATGHVTGDSSAEWTSLSHPGRPGLGLGRRAGERGLAADDRGPRARLLGRPATDRNGRPRTRALACGARPRVEADPGRTGGRRGHASDQPAAGQPPPRPRVPSRRARRPSRPRRARAGSRPRTRPGSGSSAGPSTRRSTPRCTTSTCSTTGAATVAEPARAAGATSSATSTRGRSSPAARMPRRSRRRPRHGARRLARRALARHPPPRRARPDPQAPPRPLPRRRASTASSPTTSTPTPTTAASR